MWTRNPRAIQLALFALAIPSFTEGGSARGGFIEGNLTPTRVFNQNLTVEGTQDWAVWGFANGGTRTSLSPGVHKNGGAGISSLTNITNGNRLRGLGQFGSYGQSTFNWSDGTPTVSATGAFTGLQHDGEFGTIRTVGEGFSLTVAADTGERIFNLYV